MTDMFYDKCPCPEDMRDGSVYGSVCPLCRGVGFVEAGITHGQVRKLMKDLEFAGRKFAEFRSCIADITSRIGVAAVPELVREELKRVLSETKFR